MNFSLKQSIKKLFFKEKFLKYADKGGWPGLKILPKVDYLIDVGIGLQGTEGLYKYFPDATKYFIDPLSETKNAVLNHLKNPKNKFFECALSSSPGKLKLIVRDPISQSGFSLKKNETKIKNKRLVKVETLDNLFPKDSILSSYGIKIDVG